jgi:hypothetical protein
MANFEHSSSRSDDPTGHPYLLVAGEDGDVGWNLSGVAMSDPLRHVRTSSRPDRTDQG